MRGMFFALRRFVAVMVLALLFLVPLHLELLPETISRFGILTLQAVLFVLALPLSALLRLDRLQLAFGALREAEMLFIALALVGINFVLWGVVCDLLRLATTGKRSVEPDTELP